MVRYFKKSIPDTPVVLASGRSCKFTSLDGVTGYFATDNAQIQEEFVSLIEQMRYGMSEINDAEFTRDYLDVKKNSPAGILKRRWREEIAPNRIVMDTSSSRPTPGQPSPPSPVAVKDEPSDIRRNGAHVSELTPAAAATLPDAKKEETPAPFEPPVGKRAKTTPE